MVSNLFGTIERMHYLFRDTLDDVRRLIELKIDPSLGAAAAAAIRESSLDRRRRCGRGWCGDGPILAHQSTIAELPQLQSWPDDGGAFITLPQVYTEDVDQPGFARSNLGMYRVQLSGGRVSAEREVGLHYQIHRGIGVHHAAAIRRGEPFRVNIFVGGAPAMTVAAVMPLPEGMSELVVRRCARRPARADDRAATGLLPIYAEADFCITGTIDPDRRLPEGPFGDHLGYYSLAHDFPGAASRAGVSSSRTRSGRSRSSAGRRRRTRSSASSSTN